MRSVLRGGMASNCRATHVEETTDTNDGAILFGPLVEYPVLLGLVELLEVAKEPAGARRTREHPQRRVPTPGAEDAMTKFPRTGNADREKNCEEGCEESLKGRKHGSQMSERPPGTQHGGREQAGGGWRRRGG